MPRFTHWILGGALACSSLPVFPDRMPGDRTPLSQACDPLDTTRCLLPWPSNAFTVADRTTATGLRVSVTASSLTFRDDPAALNDADGFSRVTPIVTGFDRPIDPLSLDGAFRLLYAQPGSASYGTDVPLRASVVGPAPGGSSESLAVAYPDAPLEASSDHVAVILDTVRAADGSGFAASATTRAALGLVSPKTEQESRLRAYFAPVRTVLGKAGVPLDRVVRVWDFTTRSADDPARRLRAVRALGAAAVDASTATAVIDAVTPGTGSVAQIVKGRLEGLPTFLRPDGSPSVDAAGTPVAAGVTSAPFRVVVPMGTGDYPVFMYGHGNGGSVDDDTFDQEIASVGIAKVNIELTGFDGTNALTSLVGLRTMFSGSDRASASLVQAIANEASIQRSLGAGLGALLAAPDLGGAPNATAGRRPDVSRVFAGGGSLGGSLSVVHAAADASVSFVVANVAGAAWTRFLLAGATWQTLSPLLRLGYPSELDMDLALLQSQGIWDSVDSAIWPSLRSSAAPVVLVQESIGDPVVANAVTDLLSRTLGAALVRPALAPVRGLTEADAAIGRSGLMQFAVSGTGPLDFHGFAARATPAGAAAREQIVSFLMSARAGAPRIERPAGCAMTPTGTCDFSK